MGTKRRLPVVISEALGFEGSCGVWRVGGFAGFGVQGFRCLGSCNRSGCFWVGGFWASAFLDVSGLRHLDSHTRSRQARLHEVSLLPLLP